MADQAFLCNQLLIAMPAMTDPNFSQTVTLVCEHSDRGALGLVLNRPLPMKLSDVFDQLSLESLNTRIGDSAVLRGGPVQTDRGFVIHRFGGSWDSTLKVSDRIQVTTSRDVLAAMARGEGPPDAFIALGYAGWEAGQLEQEMLANAWLSVPADETIIFDTPYEDRWHKAGRLLGIDLTQISSVAGHA
ncbi:MAG TPA: YqgE/AlgH family protein [Steroidobacteraceae bacterium]|nr:YqgE/AlgH family protein [Steroidobacteraceae bacterium]